MTRKRRSPEKARAEILAAAQEIVLNEGPSGLKIQKVAKTVGVSHPAVLHHFGSAQQLLSELQQAMAKQIREDFISLLEAQTNPSDRMKLVDAALKKIASPMNGRILAFLISSGIDPFPPVEEKGLAAIASTLGSHRSYDPQEVNNTLMLALLSMYAEGMMGDLLRKRLSATPQSADSFRHWLLRLMAERLAKTALPTAEQSSQGD